MGRTKADLYVHYYNNPLPPKPLAPRVETTADTVVLPYHKWIKNKCACCGKAGASGIWQCQFQTHTQPMILCAACGLRDAFAKWTGFFSRKLLRVDLLITLTYDNRQATIEELPPRGGNECR